MSAYRDTKNSGWLQKGKIAALAGLLAATGLTGAGGYHASAAGNAKLQVTSSPFIIGGASVKLPSAILDGESYIGIRSLNEQLGIGTSWDAKAREVVLTGRGRTMVLSPEAGYLLNGTQVYGSPAVIQAGTTFVPLRFVLESFGYGIGFQSATKTVTIAPLAENELSWQSGHIRQTATKLTLDVAYPIVTGMEDAQVQQKINARLKEDAEKYAASGRETLDQAAEDNAAAEKSYPDAELPPVEYEGSYTVTYNEQDRLSLYVDYYLYTGGAHGGIERVPYTFDLKTGELISLKDAADSGDYVKIINDVIKKEIKLRDLPLLAEFDSIEADRPYFLKHGAIVVYFQQYEYTPYAAGMPEFAVPFSAFK